jgi:hypothetical protein
MHNPSLDPETAERLIQGRVAPQDAPAGFGEVAALLQAARRPVTQSDPSRRSATVAAMAAAVAVAAPAPTSFRAAVGPRRSLRTKLAAGSAAGLLSLFGGLAAAGALPSAAQNSVADAASHVGFDLPRHGGGHGKGHHKGGSGDETGVSHERPAGATTHPDNHGACVSEAAQSTTTTSGGNHGQAVSDVARSECGKPDQATTPTSNPANKPAQPPGLENKSDTPTPHGPPSSLPHRPGAPGGSSTEHTPPPHP